MPATRPSIVLLGDTSGASGAAAHPRADEVAGDVVADRAEHEADDHADAVGDDEQQAGEAAEHADVGEAEHGDRDVDHRPGVHDLGQVPEHREHDDERGDQREGPLAVVVGDADDRRRTRAGRSASRAGTRHAGTPRRARTRRR